MTPILDYQKNGIAGPGRLVRDHHGQHDRHRRAGVGDRSQNGIVISPGATATITGTYDHQGKVQYIGPGGGPDPFNSTQAAGIVVFVQPPALRVQYGITGNDIGIASNTHGTPRSGGNTVENSFEGVFLLAGTATVSSNTIDGNNIGVGPDRLLR